VCLKHVVGAVVRRGGRQVINHVPAAAAAAGTSCLDASAGDVDEVSAPCGYEEGVSAY
jgi:hypothetical protein